MRQGDYNLDTEDDDCFINGDLMTSDQNHLQDQDGGFFGTSFNEDVMNWSQYQDFLLNRISQPRPSDDSEPTADYSKGLVQLASLYRKAVAEIMEKKDLKQLQELGGPGNLAFILGSDLVVGKSEESRQSADLTPTTVFELGPFILAAFRTTKRDRILLLLLADVAFVCGMVEEGPRTGWLLGFLIIAFLLARVAYSSLCSFCAVRKMQKRLNKQNRELVEVVRSGESQKIRAHAIAEGDIVCLKEGNKIPADGLFLGDSRMKVDGAFHTDINCNTYPFLYYGSKIVIGHGRMLVTSAGTHMEFSKLMSYTTSYQENGLKAQLKNKKELLEDRIGKPLYWLGNFALSLAIICVAFEFLLSVLLEHSRGNASQTLKSAVGVEWAIKLFRQMLDKGVMMNFWATIIPTLVLGLQHGVKIVISIFQRVWNVEQGSSEVTFQNLSSTDTMGIVTVICIDASGGLLCETAEVSRLLIGQDAIDEQSLSEVSSEVLVALGRGIGVSALVPEVLTTPTDDVLISWAVKKCGLNVKVPKKRFTIIDDGKLSPTKEGRGVVLRENDSDENTRHLHWKGDAKAILDMCTHYYKCGGQVHGIEDRRSKFEEVIQEMEDCGLQPIAFAYKKTNFEQLEENGLVLLALVGVKHQIQEGLKSMVKASQRAGIRIIFVSENELSALKALVYELGQLSNSSNNEILEGQEMRELTFDAMKERADQVTIMENSLPGNKLLMVKSLKEKGDVVAYIGGWTARDVTVLREADEGITVGNWSTEMTKKNSDVVLTSDKSFSSLIPVLEYGRQNYQKIRELVQNQLSSNISVLLITNFETIFLGNSSITIVQFLYINFILWLLGGLLLIMKPRYKELRNNPPGKRNASVLTKEMWVNIVLQVSYLVIVLLVFQFKGEAIPQMNHMDPNPIVFNGFILFQVVNYAHSMLRAGIYRSWLFLVPGIVFLMVVATVFWEKLSWAQWAFCFIVAVLPWGAYWVVVLISILFKDKGAPNRFSRLIPPAQSPELSSSAP